MNTIKHRNPQSLLNNQEINEALGNIIPRIRYLDDILTDIPTAEKIWGEKTLRATYRGYLSKIDFKYMRSQQKLISDTDDNLKKNKIYNDLAIETIKKILPKTELDIVLGFMSEARNTLEDSLINFTQEDLIPIITITDNYTVKHSYEYQCNSCDTKFYVTKENITTPIKDKDLFRSIKSGNIKLSCTTCTNSTISVLNSSNSFYPNSDEINQIGTRIKAGKRAVRKLINRISFKTKKSNDQINDLYAIRIITYNQKQGEEMLKKLKKYMKDQYKIILRDGSEIEYINYPRKNYTPRAEYSAIHIDLSIPSYTLSGEKVFRTYEVQIKDILMLQQESTQKNIAHGRHEEKDAQFIKNNWKPIHYKLEEYLLPLFLKTNL